MLSRIASGIGGVGIFFAGMHLLAENLKKLAGSRFRRTVAAWTKSLRPGILWGFAVGAEMHRALNVQRLVNGLSETFADDEDDRAVLRLMRGDCGALMKRLREEYLASDANLAAADKMTILTITNLTERASWLINRLVKALPGPASADEEPVAAGVAI